MTPKERKEILDWFDEVSLLVEVAHCDGGCNWTLYDAEDKLKKILGVK